MTERSSAPAPAPAPAFPDGPRLLARRDAVPHFHATDAELHTLADSIDETRR